MSSSSLEGGRSVLTSVGMVVVAVLGMSLAPVVIAGSTAAAQHVRSAPNEAPDESSASFAARQANKSVLVLSKTDETTETLANPNGTFTWKQHVRPVRVRREDGWTPVDTTLVRQPDGRIRTAATVVDVELSAGGAGSAAHGPLVKAAKDGVEIGLGWDGDLPEPTLSGPTATYTEVLPGVDLTVTADVLGFSEVLVIKNPEAARDPSLRKITFGSHAKGLTVSATSGGDLTAVDPSGSVVFAGSASRMWDSSGAGADAQRSSGTAPGTRRAVMGVEATGDTLAILPDQAFLVDPNTRYPVYLDPSYGCTSCAKNHHAVVQSEFPEARNFDRTDGELGDLKAGWVCERSCPSVSRTYLSMNTAAITGKWIFTAVLHVKVIHSYHCASGATPTRMWWSQAIDRDTRWNQQPAWIDWMSDGNSINNAQYCPGDGGMDLNAYRAVEYSANHGVGETTFVLFGASEGDNSSWRRFDLNPYLVVQYNTRPNAPRDLGMEGFGPGAGDAIPCVRGDNRPFLPTKTPRLRARISDPDGGMMDAKFFVYRGIPPDHEYDGNETYIGQIPSGSFAEVTVSGNLFPEDGLYAWQLWSGDYHLLQWSPICEFELDTVLPGVPSVSSAQYPADRPAGGVGQGGTFTFTASPATNDTAHYLYSFTAQGGEPVTKVVPPALNGSATVSWTPTLSGPQTLSVRAVDRAGNKSAIVRYKVVVSDYQVGISGKVASWSFENALNDGSAAKSLTYQGALPGPTYGPGQQGQSVVLDPAKGQFYQAKDALIRTDTSYTVSAWAKLERNDQHYVIASQDGDQLSGFYLHYNVDQNRWMMATSDRDNEVGSVTYTAASPAAPTLGVWTHLTGVFDAQARKLRLYVDGTLASEADVPTAAWNAKGQFIVGAGKMAGQRKHHFFGAIDSVRAHPRALTNAEVDALFRETAVGNPAAEYRFENNLDNTGANADLVPNGAPSAYTDGYSGKALRLNGSADQWTATAGPLINTTGSFSVSAWVRLDDKNGYYHIATQDGNLTGGFHLRYSADADRWLFGVPSMDDRVDNPQWAVSRSIPEAGVWTHLVAVHDAGEHKLLLYVNGVLDAERSLLATIDARGAFVVGATKGNGARTGQFKGSLDEVNVYDGALKPDEVAKLANLPVERTRYALNETSGTVAHDSVGNKNASMYGTGISWSQQYGAASASFTGNSTEHAGTIAGPGPLARWDFNNQLTDSSGNGRTLVHQNNSGSTPAGYGGGRINEGVTLNGIDQRLVTSGPVIDTTRSYSVSAWVKLNRKDGWFAVASQDGSLTAPFALMYTQALDRWTLSMMDNNTANPGVVRAASVLPPQPGVWTHLLGVYDSLQGRARLYVNGELEGDVAFTTPWPSTGSFAVGRLKWNGASTDHFPGTIDEIRVYDRALGAADAEGLSNLGSNFVVPRPAAFRTDRSFVMSAWVRHGGFDTLSRQVVAGDARLSAPITFGYRAEWRRWAVLAMIGTKEQPVSRWVLSDNEAGTYADANGWVHLAVVYDAPARKVRLYVNGIPQATVPTGPTTVAKDPNAGTNITMWDNGRGLMIGRTDWLGQPVDHWKGAIRDVRVFTGVLPEFCDNGVPTCMSQLPWH